MTKSDLTSVLASLIKLNCSGLSLTIVGFLFPVLTSAQAEPINSLDRQPQSGPWKFLVQDTLYAWTGIEQIAELRLKKSLLTENSGNTKSLALFDRCLEDPEIKSDRLAAMLGEEQFSKKLFAWTECWPTLWGLYNEKHGRQLVQIILSDSAITGQLDVQKRKRQLQGTLIFVNQSGHLLSPDYVMQNKHRIAAVYYVNREMPRRNLFLGGFRSSTVPRNSFRRTKKQTSDKHSYFRGFVIINEKMIAGWNYGTEDIKNKLRSEIGFISQLEQLRPREIEGGASEEWNALQSKFIISSAFFNKYYRLEPKRMSAIKKELAKALAEQLEPFSK